MLFDMLQEREAAMTSDRAVYTAVSDALWLQRDALHTLLYRLVCERLVLTAREGRWLARADDEARAAVDQLRGGEVLRAAEAEELARILALPPGASLGELAAASPEPWRTMLGDHRSALRRLASDVENVADEVARLAQAGAGGWHDPAIDVAYQAARQTAGTIRQLSLAELLR